MPFTRIGLCATNAPRGEYSGSQNASFIEILMRPSTCRGLTAGAADPEIWMISKIKYGNNFLNIWFIYIYIYINLVSCIRIVCAEIANPLNNCQQKHGLLCQRKHYPNIHMYVYIYIYIHIFIYGPTVAPWNHSSKGFPK